MTRQQLIKAGSLIAVPVVFVAALWLLPVDDWVKSFTGWVDHHGFVGIVVFVGGYVVGALLFIPAALLTISSGVVFGVLWGALIALVAATTSAIIAFFMARHLARGSVRAWITKHPKFRALDAAIAADGWMIIALLRASPIVPFNVSNYFFGVTKVRSWVYASATLVGLVPRSFLYAYLGHVGIRTFGHLDTAPSGLELGILVAGLAVTVAVTWYVAHLAKMRLEKHKKVATGGKAAGKHPWQNKRNQFARWRKR